uniref:Chemokine interleukin-8-like domain-containing protein n=1 Tax=Paramormyrops kingsleyae TaxID=1676925 RepID=A0A3B3SLE6_9TELE
MTVLLSSTLAHSKSAASHSFYQDLDLSPGLKILYISLIWEPGHRPNPEFFWCAFYIYSKSKQLYIFYANGPEHCCLTYFPKSLKMQLIDRYEETRQTHVILFFIFRFYTKKGNEVCVDPGAHWVQVVKKRLDQNFFQ